MEMHNKNINNKRHTTAHLLMGILFVLLGLLVLAEIVDAVPWKMKNIIVSWQMILIVLGVVFISSKTENRSTGYILLAIGTFFILPKFFDVPHYWRALFWPSMLILFGLYIIFHRGKKHHHSNTHFGGQQRTSGQDILDDVDFFSGGDRVITSQHFQGGKITHIFGGSNYDLRQAKLAPGVNYLEIVNIFGGSKFLVPEEWDIKIEVNSVFGGFSDKRHRSIIVVNPDSQLVITGVNIFGGGEITFF